MKKKLFLTFTRTALDRPILSSLTSRFGLVFNIFGASMNEETQFFAVELDGEEDQIAAAESYLASEDVKIEEKG